MKTVKSRSGTVKFITGFLTKAIIGVAKRGARIQTPELSVPIVEKLFITFLYTLIGRKILFGQTYKYLYRFYCEICLANFLAKFKAEKVLNILL
jgi:hypothetical protein